MSSRQWLHPATVHYDESATTKKYASLTTSDDGILLVHDTSATKLKYDNTEITMAKFPLSMHSFVCNDFTLLQKTSSRTTKFRHLRPHEVYKDRKIE